MILDKYIKEKKVRNECFKVCIIIFFSAILTSGFSYINWNSTYSGWLVNITSYLLAIWLVFNFPRNAHFHFRKEVLLLTFIPFLSMINSYLSGSQSFYDSLRPLMPSFIWILYFVFRKYNFSESVMLKSFFIISVFIVLVQIIQQFTYPNAYFGISTIERAIERGHTEIAENRNGLWRFRLGSNGSFTAPILFALFIWTRKYFNIKLFFLVFILLISIYLTLTRQVIGACLLTLFISFFLGRDNRGIAKTILFGGIVFFAIYSYADLLFGSFIDQTNNDLNENNIRVLGATYFWNKSVESPLYFLFGHGLPSGQSQFAQQTDYIRNVMYFYTSDVGFIGKIYELGFLYVATCYWLLWKIFFKLKKDLPIYIRMFVVFTTIMSIMIFPMYSSLNYFIWVIILTICDIYIKPKLKKCNGKL